MIHKIIEFKSRFSFIKLLLFSIATSFNCYSQDKEIDELLDELFFDDQEFLDDFTALLLSDRDFIYTTVSYSSNTYFSGREGEIVQYNIIPQTTYYHSSSLYAGVAAAYYQKFDTKWDFVNVSVGYANYFNKSKTLSYNLSYSRFFYSDGWDAFVNSVDMSLGYRNPSNTFGAIFTGTYLFGSDESLQLIPRIYGNISLVKKDKFAIKIRPEIHAIFAEQGVVESGPTDIGFVTIIREHYNLLNTQLSFPLALTTRSWDVEVGWNYNIPSPVKNEGSLKNNNFFSITIAYLLDVSKKK